MLYNEVLDRLQKLINKIPSQAELMQILEIKQSTMSERARRNSKFYPDEISKLNEYYGINLFTNKSQNNQNDKEAYYYPDVFGSCGGGAFVLSEVRERINIPQSCFTEPISKVHEYSVINAVGNSMTPYINDKDRLIVQHLKTGEQIKDNRVYVFCYNNEIYVKRLSKNVNQLIIESDNKNYDTIKLQKDEMNDIIIIGQIVGLMRDCR